MQHKGAAISCAAFGLGVGVGVGLAQCWRGASSTAAPSVNTSLSPTSAAPVSRAAHKGPVCFRLARHADLPCLLELLADDSVAQKRANYITKVTPQMQEAFQQIHNDANNEMWIGECCEIVHDHEGQLSESSTNTQGMSNDSKESSRSMCKLEVISMAQLTIIPGLSRGGAKRAQVESIRVRSDLRGQGVGRLMMEHLSNRAKTVHSCSLIQLTTDKQRPAAHRFYERLGYVGSHVGMKKQL